MSKKPFLENSLVELFEWCSLVLDNARGFYAERFPHTPSIQHQWQSQQEILDRTYAAADLRGLRIMAVDFFEAASGAHDELVQRINRAAIERFGPDTAIVPSRKDLD